MSKTHKILPKLRWFGFSTSGLNQNSKTLKTSENILKFDFNYQKRNTSNDSLCRLTCKYQDDFFEKNSPCTGNDLAAKPPCAKFPKKEFFNKAVAPFVTIFFI